MQPDNAGIWYDLGNTYYNTKRYAHAVHAYRDALRIQPENPDAWYSLGLAYAHLDERDRMRGIYQTLRKLDLARAERYFNTYILP
ncbi:Tetratricopeptide repeat-containing protein [Nitrosospira sp. Nsp18]|nr:Tetratricopeptide repeat-containing protein [Nitrosospira sp. Nsp18]